MSFFKHILLLTTFIFFTFLWDIEFRIRRVFKSKRFTDNINRRVVDIPRRIMSLTRFFLDFDIDFQNNPELEIPEHCLIISNHQSILDIPMMVYCFPHNNVRFAAKHSLFKRVPLVSQVLRLQGHARIDRTGKFSRTMKELDRLAREADKGLSPVIFPEGTRSRNGKIGTFHSGAIRRIEAITPLPILSVALNGGYQVSKLREMLSSLKGRRFQLKALAVYPPPKGKTEIENLLVHIKNEIQEQVEVWQKTDT